MFEEKHKLLFAIIIIASAGIVATLFTISYAVYNTGSTQGFPFPVSNGINIGDYFATPVSTALNLVPVTSAPTNAPAITGCTITNDVHLIAIDGSDYPLTNTSPQFSPIYANSVVSNPYNGKVLNNVLINIKLYCDPSTLAQYNYYPNLTGGNVNVILQGRNPSGQLINIVSGNTPINSATVNGGSVIIATYTIPASQISLALPTSASSYYSQQNVVTTGTLYFKQNTIQTNQLTATHVISPLYTSFSFLISPSTPSPTQVQPTINQQNPGQPLPTQYQAVQPPTTSPITAPNQVASCPPNTVTIQNACVDLIQNVVIAGGKTTYYLPAQNYVVYSVIVNSWSAGQPYPTVKVTNLDTQTSNVYTLSPGSRANGPIIAQAGTALVVTDDLWFNTDLNGVPGRYQIQLMSSPMGTFNRPTVSQDFVMYNPSPSGSTTATCQPGYYLNSQGQCSPLSYASTTGTCPNGQIPTQTSNGQICAYPSSSSPASGTTSPVTLPTQQSNNVCVTLSSNSGMCVPSNTFLGASPIIVGIQQLLLYFHAFG